MLRRGGRRRDEREVLSRMDHDSAAGIAWWWPKTAMRPSPSCGSRPSISLDQMMPGLSGPEGIRLIRKFAGPSQENHGDRQSPKPGHCGGASERRQ